MSMKKYLLQSLKPTLYPNYGAEILAAIPRVLGGLLLSLEFGSSKFGVPWSQAEKPLGFFEVASWFPEDVANFGVPFSWAPYFFAWTVAFTETIGGLFISLGLFTRYWSFLLAAAMLGAIFLQKWPSAMEYGSSWPLLPAAGFLWIAFYGLIFGSGRIGLDFWLFGRKTSNNS